MDSKPKTNNYLLFGGIGILMLAVGYLILSSKSDTELPARGQATLANFDDLAKAIPAISNNYVYVLSTSSNADKAKRNNRTPEMQAKLDSIWAYNNNKI